MIRSRLLKSKFCILAILILALSSLFAAGQESKNHYEGNAETLSTYKPDMTLNELSLLLSIPLSKLLQGLEISDAADKQIGEIGLSDEQINTAVDSFRKEKWNYSLNIVLIGMLVIFASLALTGVLVSQLRLLVIEKKNNPKQETSLSVKNKTNIDRVNSVVAAITTVHLHIIEAEEKNKMTLSWRREPESIWKASSKLLMPNKLLESKKS